MPGKPVEILTYLSTFDFSTNDRYYTLGAFGRSCLSNSSYISNYI